MSKRNVLVSKPILTLRVLELHGNQRRHVTIDVQIGEIVSGKSASWIVVDGAQIFHVGGILAIARDPDRVALCVLSNFQYRAFHKIFCLCDTNLFLVADVIDGGLQILGHILGQSLGVIVHLRYPIVNLQWHICSVKTPKKSLAVTMFNHPHLVQFQENARLPFGESVLIASASR